MCFSKKLIISVTFQFSMTGKISEASALLKSTLAIDTTNARPIKGRTRGKFIGCGKRDGFWGILPLLEGVKIMVLGDPDERPWFNIFLVFLPMSLASYFGSSTSVFAQPGIAFAISLMAMLPLAERLGFATESLAEHVPDTLAGLMNASMGNAPELIIAIFALQQGLYDVILVSLIGSMLSNLLLVLGTSLIVGSICNPPFQRFKAETSGMTASMLLLSVTAIAAPTLIVATSSEDRPDAALLISRICALFLLFLYILFLIFQMKTHSHLFDDDEVFGEEELDRNQDLNASQLLVASTLGAEDTSSGSSGLEGKEKESMDPIEGDGEEGDAKLSMRGSILWLVIIAAVVALVSENLVRSIDGAAQSWGLGQAFISCIMLPIAGNAAEHFSAVLFAKRNRLDLSLGIAIGSTLQIALFVLPLLVVLGWLMNKPVTLDSKPFQAGSLIMAVLMTVFLLLNGKSYWMSGVVLVSAYAVVATGFGMYSFEAEGNDSSPTNSTRGM